MIISNLHQFKADYFSKYNWFDLIILTLVFLFYITILWNVSIAKSCYLLLALIALYLIVTRKITYDLSKLEKQFLWSIAAYFSWIVITYFVNDMPERGGRWIMNTQLRVLLIIPIYLMLRSRPIPANAWWMIVSCGAIVAGLVSISQVSWDYGWPRGRARGDTSAIFFGEISLCLAFMTLIGVRSYFSYGKLKIILWIVSVGLGLLAMILSGTRSAWIAIPVLIILTFWYLSKNISLYKKILILITLLAIPIILFQFPYTQAKYKFATNELDAYIQSESVADQVRNSSVGLRLEVWRLMLITIKENPWFGIGIGIGEYKAELQRYIDAGEANPYIYNLPHTHNQYIEAAVTSGILGLALNLCIFILPGIIFFHCINNAPATVLPYVISGLMLILAYLIFGLTDLTLTSKVPIMFYGLSVSILLMIARQGTVIPVETTNPTQS